MKHCAKCALMKVFATWTEAAVDLVEDVLKLPSRTLRTYTLYSVLSDI